MMATRQRPRPQRDDALEHDDALSYESAFGLDSDITDEDVEDFLAEQDAEAERKGKKPGFLNLQTGAGLAIITIGMVYLLQQIGFFPLGYSLGALVSLLPWLAGVLIVLTGFGVLSWSPARRRRRERKKARERRMRQQKTAGRSGRRRGEGGFEAARRSAERAMREAGRRSERKKDRKKDRYAARRSGGRRKLARARRGRKIAGVAAGIAHYFGIDPTLVRIAFVIGAIFGNGFTIPLYFILSFVMPKAEKDDDPIVAIFRDDDDDDDDDD